MKVIIYTNEQYFKLEDFFIQNFIKNKDLKTEGELSFEMMISGETGLEKGKFNFKRIIIKEVNLIFALSF